MCMDRSEYPTFVHLESFQLDHVLALYNSTNITLCIGLDHLFRWFIFHLLRVCGHSLLLYLVAPF